MATDQAWPVSDTDVSRYLGLAAGYDADALTFATSAAVDFVERHCPILARDDDGNPEAEQPAGVVLGTLMLTARWYHRRNSPAGVVSFADFGAAQIRSSDPDVARLLRIDAYTPPRVG